MQNGGQSGRSCELLPVRPLVRALPWCPGVVQCAMRGTGRPGETGRHRSELNVAIEDETLSNSAQTLGRYRLLRAAWRTHDSSWWIAHDPQRGEVLLQLRRRPARGADPLAWRQAAGPVLALRHANILPVLDARIEDDQPVLVAEAVPGVNLAQWLAEHETMAPRQAVLTIIGVLDGLAHAHAAGVVHGRIEPAAVLLDATGRPRLTDFALGHAPVDPAGLPTASGLYLAPEVLQGAAPDVRSDLHGVGLVLHELLTGRPAVHDGSPQRAIARMLQDDLVLPPGFAYVEHGEAQLRALLGRCLARDPAQRFASAAELRDALQEWLTPALLEGSADSRATLTLNSLMRRTAQHPDLPVQTEVVRRVRRLVAAEKVNLDEIARAVLEDVAFTLKLLRMTNAAYFSSVGGGTITTVSRAVALLGFMAVRDLAGALPTLDDLPDRAQAEALRAEYLRCRSAGRLAARLCPTQAEEEPSCIVAMLQNLGRTLVQCYLPEQATQVRQLTHSKGRSEADAALAVLGMSFEDLGCSVARTWGLPEVLISAMRRPGGAVRPPERRGDWFRLLGSLGNELVELRLRPDRRERIAQHHAAVERYAKALGLTSRQVWEAADASAPSAPAAATPAGEPATPSPADALAGAVSQLRAALALPYDTHALLLVAGDAMYRALGCRRVVIALREADGETLAARHAWGTDAEALKSQFRFSLRDERDAFSALCRKGADTLIRDAAAPAFESRLPAWYRRHVNGATFLLLPLMHEGQPLGLIYLDKAEPDSLQLPAQELGLLRALRDEVQRALAPAPPA